MTRKRRRRDRIAREIAATIEMPRIMAAAMVLMLPRRGGEFVEGATIEPTRDEILEFIERMSADQLVILGDLERTLDGGREQ
jgi:hypothetical protein